MIRGGQIKTTPREQLRDSAPRQGEDHCDIAGVGSVDQALCCGDRGLARFWSCDALRCSRTRWSAATRAALLHGCLGGRAARDCIGGRRTCRHVQHKQTAEAWQYSRVGDGRPKPLKPRLERVDVSMDRPWPVDHCALGSTSLHGWDAAHQKQSHRHGEIDQTDFHETPRRLRAFGDEPGHQRRQHGQSKEATKTLSGKMGVGEAKADGQDGEPHTAPGKGFPIGLDCYAIVHGCYFLWLCWQWRSVRRQYHSCTKRGNSV
jgi:hypothetical protein